MNNSELIDNLSSQELRHMSEQIASALEDRREGEVTAAIQMILTIMKDHVLDPEFVVGKINAAYKTKGKGGKRKSKSTASGSSGATYANPSDPSQTWSGRGRRPTWLVGVEDLSPFEVKMAAPEASPKPQKASKSKTPDSTPEPAQEELKTPDTTQAA